MATAGSIKAPIPAPWTLPMVEVLTSNELLLLSIYRLIGYCKSKLQLMIAAQVKPLLIFDGCRLIMKSHTEAERRKYFNFTLLTYFP
jgi:hypothetical protein